MFKSSPLRHKSVLCSQTLTCDTPMSQRLTCELTRLLRRWVGLWAEFSTCWQVPDNRFTSQIPVNYNDLTNTTPGTTRVPVPDFFLKCIRDILTENIIPNTIWHIAADLRKLCFPIIRSIWRICSAPVVAEQPPCPVWVLTNWELNNTTATRWQHPYLKLFLMMIGRHEFYGAQWFLQTGMLKPLKSPSRPVRAFLIMTLPLTWSSRTRYLLDLLASTYQTFACFPIHHQFIPPVTDYMMISEPALCNLHVSWLSNNVRERTRRWRRSEMRKIPILLF